MNFEGLCFLALLLCAWLFLTAIDDAIELDKQKTEERRESLRQKAYAAKRQQWIKNQNRRELWQEVTGYENYLD